VPDLEACVVRICDAQDNTHGTGFLVSESLVVTCAHVAEACGAGPGDCLRLRFHAADAGAEAEVLGDLWCQDDDVAFLRLKIALPAGVQPATLGQTRACEGHPARIVGFARPAGYEFDRAEVQILGRVSHPGRRPMLRLEPKHLLPTPQVAQTTGIILGLSGAPVLDLETGRVVGLFTEFLPQTPAAWATTAETLHQVCPEISLHPPQAVADYLAAVGEYCASLPYLTLHDIRPPRTMDQVYVPLQARPQPRQKEPGPQGLKDLEGLRGTLSIAEVVRRREPPHVLILGEPGAGKSTLLRQLAERAWEQPQAVGLDAPHLPLLVPLRRLAGAEGALEERLRRALAGELALQQALPPGFFTRWPAQTGAPWLILLDALDEVPANKRAPLMQWLRGVLKGLGPNRIVITARPAGYAPGELDETLFGHYDLLPFTPEQTARFADRWFGERKGDFLRELERVRAGDLRGTPLLLTIAARVYLERGALPERRSALYGQFVDLWLDEAKQRGLDAELGQRVCKVARPGLARLALKMTEEAGQTSPEALEQVAAAYLRQALHLSADEAGADGCRFVSVMARRSGVFTRRGDEYTFIHPTFRDYLAAWAVVRECKRQDEYDREQIWRRAVSRWAEEGWRQVALFALDLLSDAGQDVTLLVERVWPGRPDGSEEDEEERLYFAGAALAEPVRVQPRLSEAIIDALLARARLMTWWEVWSTTTTNPITLLGELRGYPRAGAGLLALARDGQVDEWVRVEAAQALGELGRADEAAQAWLALARDGQVDDDVHVAAARALGELGRADEAAQAWLALARDGQVDEWVRVAAAEALGELGRAEEAAPILLALARDGRVDEGVRVAAAWALGRLGRADEAAPILLALARDGQVDEWVRERAAEALDELDMADLLFESQSEKLATKATKEHEGNE